jgi:glucose-6-phosphate-specific signal transduction histidine kinase
MNGEDMRDTASLLLPFALVFALGLVLASGLWWIYGESIYVDRLLTGIVNCF